MLNRFEALAATVVASAMIASSAAGSVVYSNIDGELQAAFSGGVVDDLQIVGGGWLEQITFTMIWSGFGAPPLTDATIILALDDGDGVPDFMHPDPSDVVLLSIQMQNLQTSTDVTFVTLDVSHYGVELPEGATIWAGVDYSAFNTGQAMYGPPTVGLTDAYVYAIDDGFPFWMPDNIGLGWELVVVPAPAGALLLLAPGLVSRRRRRS